MKKILYAYSSIFILLLLVIGVSYAAFTGKAQVLGTSITVGSADIKLLDVLTGGTDSSNLLVEKQGPIFTNVSSGWSEGYLLKIYNNSPNTVNLSSNAIYDTANDPDDLRQIITVEPVEWDDLNNNGGVDSDEVVQTLEQKTIVKWKTEGFDLGTIESGAVKGFMIKFAAESVPESKQGASALFDFEFNSLGL